MKKFLSIIVTFFISFSITSCGENSNTKDDYSNTTLYPATSYSQWVKLKASDYFGITMTKTDNADEILDTVKQKVTFTGVEQSLFDETLSDVTWGQNYDPNDTDQVLEARKEAVDTAQKYMLILTIGELEKKKFGDKEFKQYCEEYYDFEGFNSEQECKAVIVNSPRYQILKAGYLEQIVADFIYTNADVKG